VFPNHPCPEKHARFIAIVGSAPNGNVLDSCRSAKRKRLNVMKFEKSRLTAAAFRADERALPTITFPDRSAHVGWYVARQAAGGPRRRLPRVRGLGKSATLEVVDQQGQRTVEHLGLVP
jgi:hypothetical protein